MTEQPSHTCPRERPFWCAHPHCLNCNWNDDRDHHASTLAGHLGDASDDSWDATRWPGDAYVDRRRYVAWLCIECAQDEEIVRWFHATVRGHYPHATIVWHPGTPDERPA